MNTALNERLRDWAARRAPNDEHLQGLARRIHTAAAQDVWKATVVPSAGGLSRFGYAALGAAVALAVVAVVVRPAGPKAAGPGDPATLGALALFSPGEMAADQRLFAEVERLFTDRLRWVAQSNGDMALGIDPLHGESGEASAPAAVRLIVLSRSRGDTEWVPVWKTDVLLRGEEAVEVAPGRGPGNKLALWVYALADGRIAVDTALSLDRPVRLSSRNNLIVRPATPEVLMSIHDGDREYRLMQTVVMMAPGAKS